MLKYEEYSYIIDNSKYAPHICENNKCTLAGDEVSPTFLV